MIIDGIEITIVKKKIKNLYIHIKDDGKVIVSAPLRTSNKTVEDLVCGKLSWIKSKLSERKPVDESTAKIFGETYEVEYVPFDKDKAVFENGKVILFGNREKALSELYKNLLSEKLPEIIKDAERRTSKKASKWKIKKLKSKWGSCNTITAEITLSSNLAKYPENCAVFVAVHELCHLYEPSHNSRFKAFLHRFFEDYDECEKILKSRS